MRVLVAPDSLGGTLSAPAAASAIAEGWRRASPADDVRPCPLSDGGPGFVEALGATLGGELLSATVRSPLGEPVPATVLLVTDARGVRTAFVESTQATGLPLVPADLRDPTRTSSVGVGELLTLALDAGARRVVVGVGEGATHDAGAGMLAALGAGAGHGTPRGAFTGPATGSLTGPSTGPLIGGGGALAGVTPDDLDALAAVRARWAGVELVAACAVKLPLLGLHGASAAAAGTRGATPEQAQDLERAFGHLAHTAVAALGPGVVPRDLLAGSRAASPVARLTGTPGAGAGGGLGFALALLGARVLPGAAAVAEVLDLSARLADVDLALTGTGRLDGRSLHDGVPAAVAERALAAGIPTVVLAGRVEAGRRELAAAGIAAAYAVEDGVAPFPSLPDADPVGRLADRAARVARTWSPSTTR